MHGLINRSIQLFVSETFGHVVWQNVTRKAGLDFTEFESMLKYHHSCTATLLNATAEIVARPREELMEDVGTFIVSNRGFEAVRRLLRFGGIDFVDFLHSLDDLHDRVRLAIPDLMLPPIEVRHPTESCFVLRCQSPLDGYGHVLMGVLRAMADDYGALALLEHLGESAGSEVVSIRLVETEFTEGRHFDLGAIVTG